MKMMRISRRKINASVAGAGNSWWSIAVIALLVSFVVYQHWQGTHRRLPQTVREGERLKAISLRTTQNNAMRIDWRIDGRGTIVYVMSPDCVWCQKNSEAAKSVYHQTSLNGYRFIAVSLKPEGLTDYLLRYKIPFPIYIDENHDASRTLKLVATPETLVVSPSGIVQRVFIGNYVGRNAEEMRKVLGVSLPQAPAA